MSKYAPLATSNASQFVDILLRGLAGRRAGPVLIHSPSPPAKPAPAGSPESTKASPSATRPSTSRWNHRPHPKAMSTGGDRGSPPMKSDYLLAALLVMVAVAISLGANWTGSGSTYCPNPSAASVAALFAPCQAFDTAMGYPVSKQEAVRMGLLTPDEQPTPAVTQLATGY
jgi:hypothetical protein